ncbi:MAG: glycosyltransferase family 39 protein [Patescibacteria group bacterium]|nr:glycosyltransferase family 39 protein [Patescibacteria group bacterium]
MSRRELLFLLIVFISSFFLRIYRLDYHYGEAIFDEGKFYRPAALAYLENKDDPNFEHPPLGKEIMALGIKFFGDNAYGWRFLPVVFSLLGSLAVYLFVKELSADTTVASLTTILLNLDFLYFIHSRLGTIEVFFVVFSWWSIYFLYKFLRTENISSLIFGSSFFALALATKWVAPLLLIPFIIVLIKERRYRQLIALAILLLLITGAVYTLTYWPYIGRHSLAAFGKLQIKMADNWITFSQRTGFNFSLPEYIANHAFAWVLNPAWAYDAILNDNGSVQVIWAMYNPLIFFGSLILLIKYFWREKFSPLSPAKQFLSLLVLSFYLPWLLANRVEYPYYFLVGLPFLYTFLSLFLRDLKRRDSWLFLSIILTVVAVFAYFYPLISDFPVNPRYIQPVGPRTIFIYGTQVK